MSICYPLTQFETPEMTVVLARFDTNREVNPLTSAHTLAAPAARNMTQQPRAQGFDRAIMRLGLLLIVWARKRAERQARLYPVLTHERQQLLVNQARALTRRERDLTMIDYRMIR
ncbi:MAG: hypothetical protein JWO01_1763 [Microbacteriaceae bacterium]|nr:hypothetical protein [Microbacteriaceae bacterium]